MEMKERARARGDISGWWQSDRKRWQEKGV